MSAGYINQGQYIKVSADTTPPEPTPTPSTVMANTAIPAFVQWYDPTDHSQGIKSYFIMHDHAGNIITDLSDIAQVTGIFGCMGFAYPVYYYLYNEGLLSSNFGSNSQEMSQGETFTIDQDNIMAGDASYILDVSSYELVTNLVNPIFLVTQLQYS